MAKRMGFEGKLYWGPAGSTGTTELTIARDVGYRFDVDQDQIDLIDYARFTSFDEVRDAFDRGHQRTHRYRPSQRSIDRTTGLSRY